ncbi:MAG: HesA/MoeB/ThiF family protein [Thermoplasmataceae archaeon]
MPFLEFDRYLGTLALSRISLSGQKKISAGSVAVVGLGGTGGIAAELFARAGVASLVLIDDDSVSLTNIQRQVEYVEADIGKGKAETLGKRIFAINHNVKVEIINERITMENASVIGKPSMIFDGTDNFSARSAINRYAVKNGIPWVMTAANETFGTIKAIVPHETSCTACLGYPDSGNEGIGCAQAGILPSAPVAIGTLAFSLSLKILMGEKVDGDIVYIDAWDLTMERIKTSINPKCRVCGIP